jgi:excisionase family DNA binding protein
MRFASFSSPFSFVTFPMDFFSAPIMTVKLILELNGRRPVLSLDELAESFLEAIRSSIRQEIQQVLPSGSISTPPHEKKPEAVRPVALSKAKAAQALGVSVRTLDYCISQRRIRVLRIGRRVLVPMNSIEAVLKRGVLESPRNGRAAPLEESSNRCN